MGAIQTFLASMPYAGSRKYENSKPLVALITWQMVIMAEAWCGGPNGEIESRSALVRSACELLTRNNVVIPDGADTATYLRKSCGKLFWRLVSLRFSPARRADAAAYAAFLLLQAEAGFRKLLNEQISRLPAGPEFKYHRSVGYGLFDIPKALACDAAIEVMRGWEREARSMRGLITVGRELFK